VALRTALRRGWFFGGQAFREKLLELVGGRLAQGELQRSDGYAGEEVQQHGERRAERLLAAGLRVLEVDAEGLRGSPCNDWRKGLLAEVLQAETTMKLDWIRDRLAMGDRSYCCRLIRRTRERLPGNAEWQELRRRMVEMSINHDFSEKLVSSD
jgi:hypothetical protein